MLTNFNIKDLFDYCPLTGNLIWKIDASTRAKTGQIAGCVNKVNKYRQITYKGKIYYNHRLVWLWHYNEMPIIIDHIDSNRSNNLILNLRLPSRSQNSQNSLKQHNTSSMYKGVSWDNRASKWKSRIVVNKKLKHLGYFDNEKDAAVAYNAAAKFHYSDFANINLKVNMYEIRLSK